MKTYNTDDLFRPAQEAPTPDEQATRFIDVHIYDLPPQDEPPTVESQLAAEPATPQEDKQEPSEPVQAPRRHPGSRRLLVVVGLALCLVVVGGISVTWLVPILTPTATITIVTTSKQITTSSVITVVAGQAPTAEQIAGRTLPAVTMSQQQTVPTTGKAHQDAKAAHGLLTFYNAAPYSQTIAAGTMVTGTDGVEIITDQDALLPAASYPIFGQTTVVAHTAITGPAGNIVGGDIYGPCCRLNVSAANGPFTGGQNARDYQTVTAQDIRTVATSLNKGVLQSMQAALQTQVHADETLITPLACQQHIAPDHQPGEEARQVQIIVSETCRGMTYTTHTYQRRLTQIMSQQARDGYLPLGDVHSSIIQATVQDQHRIQLHVSMVQDYTYHVSQEQQLKTLIAGKEKAQAISMLLHVPGIQSVSVSSATIPTDIKNIRVIVVYAG